MKVVIIIVLLFGVSCLVSGAASLPDDEVQALKDIGNALGKKWDFSVDPCEQQNGWFTSKDNAVLCNCTFNGNTTCHVVSIALRFQSFPGTLPKELVQLTYLQKFDVVSNYLNGAIPLEWGSMPNLQILALSENRLSGSVPKELGNISTLTGLGLEANQLSGVLPPELGNLVNLQVLWLNSNNFTGELPTTFAKLTLLRDVWLNDNQFTGKIPDFIEKWTNIDRLVIEGSGLQGPIPSGIAALKKLTDLRISDLNGTEATFPELGNLDMLTLILRSCNLIGELPDYVGKMTKLLTLDISFNKLTGELPSSLENLATNGNKYLTGNLFTGPVPDWILNKGENFDISYNNFTTKSSRCQERSVNLFASSSGGNHLTVSCLESLQCPERMSSLHINCGGKEVKIGGTTYSEDIDGASPARFFESRYNWAYSSTGNFMDDTLYSDNYIWSNTSRLLMENVELYMNARLSPLSLTYYGYCLMNGNYTVSLHFAEIVFTDDQNYTSLGRRVFDVYIQVITPSMLLTSHYTCVHSFSYEFCIFMNRLTSQDKLVLKDFNIAEKAGSAGKPVVKNFTIPVTSGTLEIRLYWAGKGTIAIPDRGFYGPLISAISINPDFVPPKESKKTQISSYAIAGIVAGVAFVIFTILGVYYGRECLRRKHKLANDIKRFDLQTSAFTLAQIKEATNNFDDSNKIGEGGFGPVYKGLLSDGTVIAVKQLSSKSKQGNREFLNELGMITALQHPHLVKLYGCCIEGSQLLLVYEYLEKNSLACALFGPKEFLLELDWPTRQKICLGIARGLAFLHEESRLKVVHKDIKTTNVLLDKNLNPKISDFGLAKLNDGDNTHMSTRIAGTYGYMAPEYAMHGYLTDKADVYSFGIVALEIVSGRRNMVYQQNESFVLVAWAQELQEKGNVLELVDPRLGSNFKKKEIMRMIDVALLCTNFSPALRPAMSSVVSMLEGKIAVPSPTSVASAPNNKTTRKQMEHNKQVMGSENMTQSTWSVGWTSENVTQGTPTDGPGTRASISGNDLYPLVLDTDTQKPSN